MTREEILNNEYGELGDPERELTSKPYSAVMAAMDEYMKQCCLELLEYMAKNDVKCTWYEHEVKGIVYSFRFKGEAISKEQLFENFL